MDLENIMLSEISQSEKKYLMISLIVECNELNKLTEKLEAEACNQGIH